jgi:hypothetical protein
MRAPVSYEDAHALVDTLELMVRQGGFHPNERKIVAFAEAMVSRWGARAHPDVRRLAALVPNGQIVLQRFNS